jgi:hypothetical protein
VQEVDGAAVAGTAEKGNGGKMRIQVVRWDGGVETIELSGPVLVDESGRALISTESIAHVFTEDGAWESLAPLAIDGKVSHETAERNATEAIRAQVRSRVSFEDVHDPLTLEAVMQAGVNRTLHGPE